MNKHPQINSNKYTIAIILNVTPWICAQKVFTTKHRSKQRYNNNKNTNKTRAKKGRRASPLSLGGTFSNKLQSLFFESTAAVRAQRSRAWSILPNSTTLRSVLSNASPFYRTYNTVCVAFELPHHISIAILLNRTHWEHRERIKKSHLSVSLTTIIIYNIIILLELLILCFWLWFLLLLLLHTSHTMPGNTIPGP